ncbi:MAG: alanine racemase [Acidimicrobiia bacterium]|nr:alanine racemase [Acidimicrobiia bacterium]MDH5505381.1 alanine racemase [Acidimicrobiia bacterium]
MRPTRVVVDLAAITANVAALKAYVQGAIVCPAVKADGYGHGDVPVANAAVAGGADWLSVATVEEGIRLREAGVEVPILLLSEPTLSSVASVIAWDLCATVYSQPFVQALASLVSHPTSVHLKVDTGMHRVGATPEHALTLARMITDIPNLELEGVWSHLAVADSDPDFTHVQQQRFSNFLDSLGAAGIHPPIRHLANTAGIFAGHEYWFDMVRPGIGIYGLPPNPEVDPPVPLTVALRLESAVSHIQRLEAGERPSYGRRRPLSREATVVTVPIGYADGYGRGLSEAEVLIGGARYPVAGTVTMDQILVDVGDAEISIGTPVVLIGRQGEDEITATELADRLDTINYEVVARLGSRLRRVYQP